jgi:hypothetical protein
MLAQRHNTGRQPHGAPEPSTQNFSSPQQCSVISTSAYVMYSYSQDLSRRGSSSIALPPGMTAGAVIGKGGSNIKLLQSRSGARLSVNSNSGRVEVFGSTSAVNEALKLLRQQFEAFAATGASTACYAALLLLHAHLPLLCTATYCFNIKCVNQGGKVTSCYHASAGVTRVMRYRQCINLHMRRVPLFAVQVAPTPTPFRSTTCWTPALVIRSQLSLHLTLQWVSVEQLTFAS